MIKEDKLWNKRAQLTIFIIIAVVVVVVALLLFFFFPDIKSFIGISTKNPEVFIQNCIEDEIQDAVKTVSLQGGSLEPEHFILYQDQKLEYLCYTRQYYTPCVMQQPLLKQHIEEEIKKQISPKAQECFEKLKSGYEGELYDVSSEYRGIDIELLPNKVVAKFNNALTLTKQGSQTYEGVEVFINNDIYELVSLATSILNWEAHFGDSETTVYMDYYHDLKVEKLKQSEGTTIYILTDRDSGNKFQFASRSVAWPPGYGNADMVL